MVTHTFCIITISSEINYSELKSLLILLRALFWKPFRLQQKENFRGFCCCFLCVGELWSWNMGTWWRRRAGTFGRHLVLLTFILLTLVLNKSPSCLYFEDSKILFSGASLWCLCVTWRSLHLRALLPNKALLDRPLKDAAALHTLDTTLPSSSDN